MSPYAYLKAVSDGADPGAADKAEVQAQVAGGRLRALVFNSQNSTPEVRSLVALARQHGVPVVTITELPEPATATFQDWQAGQLAALLRALGG